MRGLIIFSFLAFAITRSLTADDEYTRMDLDQSVAKSISWLEDDMQAWRKEHGCAACHHGPMYVWAMNTAKKNGYRVREPLLSEMTEWLLTSDEARIFPKQEQHTASQSSATDRMTAAMMGQKKLSQPVLYLTHALNSLPSEDPNKQLGWKRTIEHLATAQNDDGSFAGRDAWRPIFNTKQILTRFAVSGIQDSDASLISLDRKNEVLRAGRMFLANQIPDETQQGIVLQIMCKPKLHASHSSIDESQKMSQLVDSLRRLQRTDGGWSQSDDRNSDAFATGQSLTALNRAGITASVKRGMEFLLKTQSTDGTWPMTSRPNPENGKPAENLNPITYAATAWATMGLIMNRSAFDPMLP